ncbi:MAG: ABC transporter permease [Proteobacteria bacterium]|nr:ABC transporter permease [Pseudomonadota bacterium]
MLAFFEQVGLFVIHFFEFIGGLVNLFLEVLSWIFKGAVRPSLTVNQMAILGVSSIGIVVVTCSFAGMVVALQLANYAVRYGVVQYAGGAVALSMAREFAPMLSAIVVAGRAGSAITAEIGSMKVTEQIDALRVMGVSPTRYLVVPRFLGLLCMMPLLSTFAGLGGFLGGALVAKAQANIQYSAFFDSAKENLVAWDIYAGLIKSAIFACEIALVSCLQGLTTKGGAAGVGRATTTSVVNSMLLVFITNYFLSAWMFPPK